MNNQKSKKFRQEFKATFKDKIHEVAEKLVTDEVQKKLNTKDKLINYVARQRDICFLIGIVLLITNVVVIWLWWNK